MLTSDVIIDHLHHLKKDILMKHVSAFKWLVLQCAGFTVASAAMAQSSPLGLWRTMDDATGKPRGEVRIQEKGGKLVGTLVRSLAADTSKEPLTCKPCADDRKDQPMAGLEMIRGAQAVAGSPWFEDGEILDPDNGKIYKLKMRVEEGGKALLVRGYIGPFYRTQTWERAQ
jgi:uncharacterized protein (DUF2147 family)